MLPSGDFDQGINYMARTSPPLLWEWVNAKHTDGVPHQSWFLLPHCWTVDLPQGQSMCALLLLRGLSALSQALQVLLRLCSPLVGYAITLSTGTSQSLC